VPVLSSSANSADTDCGFGSRNFSEDFADADCEIRIGRGTGVSTHMVSLCAAAFRIRSDGKAALLSGGSSGRLVSPSARSSDLDPFLFNHCRPPASDTTHQRRFPSLRSKIRSYLNSWDSRMNTAKQNWKRRSSRARTIPVETGQ
jgi:hypothetical protein